MANYVENFASKLDWSMPFQRTGKFPLDRTDLFSSYADAVKYAAGNASDPDERGLCGSSYIGQVITVFENDTVKCYIIDAARALQEVGSATQGDGDSIVLVDGILALKGFTEAIEAGEFEGKTPRISQTGELEWVAPDTTTVDGIQTLVAGLQSDVTSLGGRVSALEGTVGDSTEGLVKDVADHTTGIAALDDRMTAAEESIEAIQGAGYQNATQVESAIQTAIAATGHAHFEKVDAAPSVETAEENVLYLVMNSSTNHYDIYALVSGEVVLIDDTTVDLTAYSNTEQMNSAIATAKQEAIDNAADDATTKAGTAEQNAKDYADSLASNYASAEDFNSHVEDAIAHITADERNAWNSASEKAHEHSNKNLLDQITEEKISAWDGAATASHEHSNKTLLDQITEEKVNQWDAAQANVLEGVQLNGVDAEIKDKKVNIPAATEETLGLVKVDNDTISSADGVVSINNVGVSKLYVEEGTELILDGGNA